MMVISEDFRPLAYQSGNSFFHRKIGFPPMPLQFPCHKIIEEALRLHFIDD
jgi:hypothetical protein